MHPKQVIHLEHDGKVLLVDDEGNGPMMPVQGRNGGGPNLRFPTLSEVESLGLPVQQKGTTVLRFGEDSFEVLKGYPKIDWPENWAWKDNCIADNCVHPVAREAIYRSLHRLVSKVMVQNSNGDVLMAKVERGHFHGFWTLPGGYMDHDEHPAIGCVRETLEELGLEIILEPTEPVVTQNIFNDEGISFVSFTYKSTWDGNLSELKLQTEEISEAKWFTPREAHAQAVSYFDKEALRSILN
ncbi:MAG: NUDIX hydrolase [Euryarchaeota archaeon]|jgi:ADP-ribose pyrophosphatase YjhB (NUDIX family)|nr:NUDIX hydrolase [Euryarchaeota archaeon]